MMTASEKLQHFSTVVQRHLADVKKEYKTLAQGMELCKATGQRRIADAEYHTAKERALKELNS